MNSTILRMLALTGIGLLSTSLLALATINLAIGGLTFITELATSPQTRHKGLMRRSDLKPEQAMLFVFPQKNIARFWMHNTPINLRIAFIDDHGIIIQTENMQAYTKTLHVSKQAVRFALEILDTPEHRVMVHVGLQLSHFKRTLLPLVEAAR